MTSGSVRGLLLFLITTGALAAQGWFDAPQWQAYPISVPASGVVLPALPLVADFDNDGVPDVAMAVNTPGGAVLHCYMGASSGGVAAPLITPMPGSTIPSLLDARDLDLDGNADLVLYTPQGVRTLMGLGTGLFAPLLVLPGSSGGPAGISWTSYEVTDLEADGLAELIIWNACAIGSGSNACVWTWSGGYWIPRPSIPLPGVPAQFHAADVNGDGFVDLVIPATTAFGARPSALWALISSGSSGIRVGTGRASPRTRIPDEAKRPASSWGAYTMGRVVSVPPLPPDSRRSRFRSSGSVPGADPGRCDLGLAFGVLTLRTPRP